MASDTGDGGRLESAARQGGVGEANLRSEARSRDLLLLSALLAVVVAVVLALFSPLNVGESILAGFAAPVLGGWVLHLVDRLTAIEISPQSRARVREAERELEDALRQTPAGIEAESDANLAPHPSTAPSHVPLGLPELWKVTHTRLDHYHETALGQARRSFRSAQLAMWVGFVLLVAFVLLAVKASTTAGSAAAGGLGAVSAALAGYVSRTFVKSQEAAAGHLRAYFDQPLALSRYLAAERLLRDSGLGEEKRSEVLGALVLAMASDPQAPPGGDKQAPPSA
ncbi:hypothetical protein ACFYMX_15180 [Streptomyces griseofuscus]|uniref:hypothetical protein n=1 Tax=Streptomyces griseofuscus TaxID=146922 RepID=UPI0036C781B1